MSIKPEVLFAAAAALILTMTMQTANAVDGPTVQGDICMQKVFGYPVTNANKLNCTAGDISLAKATDVSPKTCTKGQYFDLTATFQVNVTANSRYDGGFFFRTDGGANARGGISPGEQCTLSALTPKPPPGPGLNLDGDTAGDLNSGTYLVQFELKHVYCDSKAAAGLPQRLSLPNCTSWHSNQGTPGKISNPFNTTDALTFNPDTKSKCKCDDDFTVDVIVEAPQIAVQKDASPATVAETGGVVQFSAAVTNSSAANSVFINSVNDDKYGNLAGLSACATGAPSKTQPGACTPSGSQSCPGLIGQEVGPTLTKTCYFSAWVSGNYANGTGQHEDTVTYCATGDANTTGTKVCKTDNAIVKFTNVPTPPSLTKTPHVDSCNVRVNYDVVVANQSTVDTLYVTALKDDQFGDITATHPASSGVEEEVALTNCGSKLQGIASSGLAPGGSVMCTFTGVITACNVDHKNIVTGTTVDDDGDAYSPKGAALVTVKTSGAQAAP